MSADPHFYDVTLTLEPAGAEGRFTALLTLPGHPAPIRGSEPVVLPLSALAALEQHVLSPRPGGLGFRGIEQMRSAWSGLPGPHLSELERCLADGQNATAMKREQVQRLQESLGTLLFEAIFRGPIRAGYDQAYRQARRHAGMQIRLQLCPSLQNLPFELLRDPVHRLFLAANTSTMLVRGAPGLPGDDPDVEGPLRLLVVIAAPTNAPALNVQQELSRLKESLRKLVRLGIWRVKIVRGPDTLGQLQTAQAEGGYHVLHFIGHGVVDAARGRNGLVLENPDRTAHVTDPDDLIAVLAGFHQLRLIVLNACHGGRELAEKPFSSIAQLLLCPEVPAVVAMQRQVADVSAVRFTEHLYRALANGRSIGEAVNWARTSLKRSLQAEELLDWFNPQVFLHTLDGRLFVTRDGRLPVERKALECLEQGDLSTALKAFELAGDRESVRLAGRLAELGSRAFATGQWLVLDRLVGHCRRHHVKVPGLARWQSAARRRRWLDRRLRQLERRLDSEDPVCSSQAFRLSQRMLDGIMHDDDRILARLYGDDTELRERCWSEDSLRLKKLRVRYRGKPLPASVLEAIALVDRLVRHGGLPVVVPAPLREPVQRGEEGTVSLLPAFFVHRIADPEGLVQARGWLVGQSTEQPLEQWLEAIASRLGPDAALLWRTGGDTERAVRLWEEESRHAATRGRLLEICHHLALAQFPLTEDGRETKELGAWGERELAPWVVLFAAGPTEQGSYWLEWCHVRETSGLALPPDAARHLRDRLEGWLENQLAVVAAPAPTTPGGGFREGLEFVGTEMTPAAASAWASWLEHEREVARLIDDLLHQSGQRQRWVASPAAVRRLGLGKEIVRLYRSLESMTSGVSLERLVEVRMLFSSLEPAWRALRDNAPPARILAHLARLACPACRPRGGEATVTGVGERPVETRVGACRPGCPTFASANVLHAHLEGGHEVFLADLARVRRTMLLRCAREELDRDRVDLHYFDQLMGTVRGLADEHLGEERAWRDLESRILERVAQLGAEPAPEALENLVRLLRSAVLPTTSRRLRTALADLLLANSEQEFAAKRFNKVVEILEEALSWDDDRSAVRERLCVILLAMAEVHADNRDFADAGLHLTEFDRCFAPLRSAGQHGAELEQRAEALRTRLSAPISPPPSPTRSLDDLLDEEADSLWEDRAREAEEAIPEVAGRRVPLEVALGFLNDATYLAPRLPAVRERLVGLYLALADAVRLVAEERRILESACRLFPENDHLRRRRDAALILPE